MNLIKTLARTVGQSLIEFATETPAAPTAPSARAMVQSSVIKSVGFTPTIYGRGLLLIEFCSGDLWAYDDVLRGEFEDLTDGTRSAGSFFTRKIKPFHTGRKID